MNLKNAREIKEWIEKLGDTRRPSKKAKDEEEKRLGRRLEEIKRNLTNPYKELKTEEEKEEFREEHPEIDEVLEIINEIDIKCSELLKNARVIKEWIEKNQKIPLPKAKDKEEQSLGNQLKWIMKKLINPYKELKTEEEREEFRKQHPEIDEVLEIITDIDMQYGTKKQKDLAILIRQDLEKRRMLKEAKELESSYMTQLSKVEGLAVENDTIETDLDEQ